MSSFEVCAPVHGALRDRSFTRDGQWVYAIRRAAIRVGIAALVCVLPPNPLPPIDWETLVDKLAKVRRSGS
jgi:hypothetical protein